MAATKFCNGWKLCNDLIPQAPVISGWAIHLNGKVFRSAPFGCSWAGVVNNAKKLALDTLKRELPDEWHLVKGLGDERLYVPAGTPLPHGYGLTLDPKPSRPCYRRLKASGGYDRYADVCCRPCYDGAEVCKVHAGADARAKAKADARDKAQAAAQADWIADQQARDRIRVALALHCPPEAIRVGSLPGTIEVPAEILERLISVARQALAPMDTVLPLLP